MAPQGRVGKLWIGYHMRLPAGLIPRDDRRRAVDCKDSDGSSSGGIGALEVLAFVHPVVATVAVATLRGHRVWRSGPVAGKPRCGGSTMSRDSRPPWRETEQRGGRRKGAG